VADQLSWVRIAGVALLLFSCVLLGVGIHHLVATGTCSSTGYSANYGPVPHCPAGTGWWFAFLFVGIFAALAGATMAGSMGLIFAGIFGAIGIGALTLAFDAHARNGTRVFGGVFGGVFALVGITAAVIVLVGAVSSLRSGRGSRQVRYGKTKTSSRPAPSSPPPPSSSASSMGVPTTTPGVSTPTLGLSTPTPAPLGPTPLNLVPGLQAAKTLAANNTVDELSKLSALHDQGNLTDEEFASAKAKLLGEL
jgi:hypothetical protein